MKMNLTGIRAMGKNGPRTEKRCPVCGCMFYTKPSKDKKYCDQACSRQAAIDRGFARLVVEMTKP